MITVWGFFFDSLSVCMSLSLMSVFTGTICSNNKYKTEKNPPVKIFGCQLFETIWRHQIKFCFIMIETGTCQNNKIRGYGHKQNVDWVCDLTSVITSVSAGWYFSFPSKNWIHTAEEQHRIGPYMLTEYFHILLGELRIYFD